MAVLAATAASALIAVSLPTIAFAEGGAETPPDISSQTSVETSSPDAATTSEDQSTPADPAANPDPASDPAPNPELEAVTPADPPAEQPATDAATPPADEPPAEEPLTTEGTDPPKADAARQTAPLVQSREAPTVLALAANLGNQAPPAGGLKFVVKKGGARDTGGAVSALPGASFSLFQAANTNNSGSSKWNVSGSAVSTCTTDANGMCYLYSPGNLGGTSSTARTFIVKETSAPANWSTVTSWGSGADQTYAFKYINKSVSGDEASRTFYAPSESGSNDSRTWPDVASNGTLPNTCGLDIALVMDLSGSIAGVGGGNDNTQTYKNAAKGFVSALAGTPTRMSLFTFASQSPASGASNVNVLNKSLNPANGADRTAFDNAINGATIPGSSNYYTNWDAAFRNVLSSGQDYDLVLFMTDGDPTTYATGTDTDTSFMLRNVEEAIHSANAVKLSNGGTHVMAIGIGGSVNTDAGEVRLSQISGEGDYFTTGFDTLGQTLKDIASKACAGNLVVTKQLVGADGSVTNSAAQGWQFNATDTGVAGTVTGTTGVGTGAVSFPVQFGGSTAAKQVSVTETGQAGYVLYPQNGNNAVCTVNGGGTITGYANVGANGFTVNVLPDQTINCVVQNQQTSATVKVNKQWVVKDAGGATLYSGPNAPAEFGANLTLSKAPANPPVTFGTTHTGYTGGANGDVLTIGETNLTKPVGCAAPVVSYASNSGAAISNAGVTGKLNLGANEYTITNTYSCDTKLTLKKVITGGAEGDAAVANTDWTLTATKPAGSAVAGPTGQTGVSASVTPGASYTLSETPGANAAAKLFALDGWSCAVDGQPATSSNGSVSVALGHSTVCTATNKTAHIKLIKEVVGGNDAASTFSLTATPAAGSGLAAASVDGSAAGKLVQVKPGVAYTLSESGPSGYDSNLQCLVGNEFVAVAGGLVTPQADGTTTCRFTNTAQPAKLKLYKVVSGASNVAADQWTLTATSGNSVLSYSGGAAATSLQNVLPGASYTLAESSTMPGASEFSQSAWTCDSGAVLTDGNKVTVAQGKSATCYVTNTLVKQDLTFDKKVKSTTQGADGNWTIVYDLTVTNPSKIREVNYDLSDTLAFGSSVTIASAGVTGPAAVSAWTNPSTTKVIATGRPLAAGASEVWTVTVVASLAAGANFATPASVTDCVGTPGSGAVGFLNTASLKFDGKTVGDKDCSLPAKPSFSKVGQGATQNSDGSWDVSYLLTAANNSDKTLYYGLTDPAITPPAGVTVVSSTVTAQAAGTPAPGALPTIATANPIAAGATHSYKVVIKVTVAANALPGSLDCETKGGGIINAATLISGGQSIPSSDCVSIVPPVISHTKTITSTTQNANGSWTIVYNIVVTNEGTVSGSYSLADELRFGAGATVDTASAVGPSGAIAGWPASSALATNALIGAGAQHSYTVTATTGILPAGFIGSTDADCLKQTNPAETGTGFWNAALLTANGATSEKSACSSPALPKLAKTFVSALQQADGTWNVSYNVSVTNPVVVGGSNSTLFYTLNDSPAFPAGVAIVGTTVTRTSPLPATPTTLPFTGQIESGAEHVYSVVINADVPPGAVTTEQSKCKSESNPTGIGFLNTATLTSGADSQTAQDCGPITEGVVPTITKTVASGYPQQQSDGTWLIRYVITVTNPSATLTTSYSLDDTLNYGAGISIVGTPTITQGAGDPTPKSDWNGTTKVSVVGKTTLAASGVDHYTVDVQASVAANVAGTEAANCEITAPELGTGFLNTALLHSGTNTTPATACGTPAKVTVTKTATDAVREGAGWKITYVLTATNTSATTPALYSLSDTLGFAANVAVTSASVANTTPGSITVSPTWNGASNTAIVTNQAIAANGTHSYTVTVNATVGATVADGDLTCSQTPGKGFFNSAVLTSGSDAPVATACSNIPVTVTVDKKWVIEGTPFNNGSQPDGFTAALNTSVGGPTEWGQVATAAAGSTLSIEEYTDLPNNCTLTSSEGTGNKTLNKAVNEFVVTNTVDCTQSLTLVKEVNSQHGGVADASEWTLTASAAGSTVFEGAGTASSTAVAQGIGYTLTESGPAGWVVDTDWSCENEVIPSFAPDAASEASVEPATGFVLTPGALGTARVALDYGAHVRCTIVNTDVAPKLVLVKKVDPTGTVPPTSWNLFATGAESERVVQGLGGVAATAVNSNTVYTLGEEAADGFANADEFTAPAGWSCGVGDARTASTDSTVTLSPGQVVTCEITNVANAGRPDVEKTVLSTVQNSDGTWTITYDVSVHNLSTLVAIKYDLSDSFNFGSGITVDEASASGPTATAGDTIGAAIAGWNGRDATVLATDKVLAADGTHHYLVKATATVTAAAWENETTSCIIGDSEISAGGFLNEAVVMAGDFADESVACSEPGRATAVKAVAGSPVNLGSGQWQMDYTITVTNGSEQALRYDLSDAPKLPEGVVLVSATATDPSDAPVAGWNGKDATVLASGHSINPGSELPQVWKIRLVVQASGIADIDAAKCYQHTPQNGLFNSASFTNGTIVTQLDACADLPIATITLRKVVDNTALDGYDVEPLTSADWNLAGSAGGPTGIQVRGDAGTTFVVPAGTYGLSEAPTTRAGTDPLIGLYVADKWTCAPTGSVTVNVGDAIECSITNRAVITDMGIVKHVKLKDGAHAVQAGDTFEYKLIVTNYGSDGASNIVVTDNLPATLEQTGPVQFPAGQGWVDASTGNALKFTNAGPMAHDATATIVIPVKMKADAAAEIDSIGPDGDPDISEPDMSDIRNKACVTSAGIDFDESNNCDWVEVPTKRIDPAAYVQCVNDVPWLNYDISTANVAPGDITVTWTAHDGSVVTNTIPWSEREGKLLWPYGEVNSDGISIAWPGWRVEQEGDDTNPNVIDRWQNMVKDTSLPSYSFSDTVNPTSITFSINPSATVLATYPMATPECAAERVPDVSIVKTASVERVDLGGTFDYTLAVSNSGLGAATPVTLTDEIPADLKVTGIETDGSPAFPRWQDCEVTGQDAAGFGGTLNCDLLGMLGRDQSAPDVVLSVLVNPESTATKIDNTGTVCWSGSEQPNPERGEEGARNMQCADSEVPVLVKQVQISGLAQCVNDAPYFNYSVTPVNVAEQLPIHLIWWTKAAFDARNPELSTAAEILANGASKVDEIAYPAGYVSGDTITGTQLWPGAAVDAAGKTVAWPGWTQLPTGQWVLDPKAPFYDLRGETVVEIRINPTSDVTVAYPPSTPNCKTSPTNPPAAAPASLPSTGFAGATPFAAAVIMLGLGLVVIVMAARRRRGNQS